MVQLQELPEDVVLVILGYLSPEDLLSVQQTCRGMHVLGSSEHVWHALKFDVPLDLPSSLSSHPAHLIQQSAVRALRLDQNWRKKDSNIRRLTHIPDTGLVKRLQFLGQAYLVTISQTSNLETFLSLWHIAAPVVRIARIEVPMVSAFAASLQGGRLLVALAAIASGTTGNSSLRLYTLDLTGDLSDHHEFRETFSHPLSDPNHILSSDVHISDRFAAARVAVRYEVDVYLLLIDLDTLKPRLIEMPCQGMQNMSIRFKLYNDTLFVTGVFNSRPCRKLVILRFDVQTLLQDLEGPPEPLARYEINDKVPNLSLTMDYYISPEPTIHGSDAFPIVVHHSAYPGTATLFYIPLDTEQEEVQTGRTFPMAHGSSMYVFCLGETGKRAVWLEQRLEEYEPFRFRKSLDKEVVSLWPAHIGLPFQPHECHAMYFEECSGRIGVSLHTEDVYIMEF